MSVQQRSRRKSSLSARIQNFDINDDSPSDHAYAVSRTSRDKFDAPVVEPLKVEQEFLTCTEDVRNVHKTYLAGDHHYEVQTRMVFEITPDTVLSQPHNLFDMHCSVTPSRSSESFYSCAEPVKLFDTPKTPTSKAADPVSVTSTPLSLGIGSLLSPNDFLFSPNNMLTDAEDVSALLSELLHSENGFSTPQDPGLCFLDDSPATNERRFTQLRSSSFGFQANSKSLGSLLNCDKLGTDEGSLDDQGSIEASRRLKMVRQLHFETPSILRKRRRGNLWQKSSIKNEVSESLVCLTEVSDSLEIQRPASPPGIPMLKIEDPFTPSRFLNSPQMVTSTPVCSKPSLSSTDGLNSGMICNSPPAKRLLWYDLPRTPTPFKTSNAGDEQRHLYDEDLVKDEIVEDEIDQLPFSAFTVLDALHQRDSIIKTETVEKDVAGCQATLGKSLEKPWSAPANTDNFTVVGSLISLETPSKSLIGDESLMFSPPPWMIRDTLQEVLTFDRSTPPSVSHVAEETVTVKDPSTSLMMVGWERVACGQTVTQMELVKQAKELLDDGHPRFRPRSLKL